MRSCWSKPAARQQQTEPAAPALSLSLSLSVCLSLCASLPWKLSPVMYFRSAAARGSNPPVYQTLNFLTLKFSGSIFIQQIHKKSNQMGLSLTELNWSELDRVRTFTTNTRFSVRATKPLVSVIHSCNSSPPENWQADIERCRTANVLNSILLISHFHRNCIQLFTYYSVAFICEILTLLYMLYTAIDRT